MVLNMDIKFHQNSLSHFQDIEKKLKKYLNKELLFLSRYVHKTNQRFILLKQW